MAFKQALLAAAIGSLVAVGVGAQTAPPPPAAMAPHDGQRPTADTDRTESTGDFNVAGDVAVTALIGAKLRNDDKEIVGTVEDLFVDERGAVTTVVVSAGGFLGLGARSVGVRWQDVRRSRDGGAVVLITRLGKEELKALPPYIAQLRRPAPQDQAAARR